jgi:hypothetical protein
MSRSRAALAVLALVLIWPAAALAQQSAASPLSPFSNQAPTTTTATTPPVTTSGTSTSAGGFTSTDAVLIGLGAFVVLGGISFFIWRDARRRAPIRHHAATATVPGSARQRQKSRKLSPAERKRRKRGKAR